MIRISEPRASLAKWLVLVAVVWFTDVAASGSIVGTEDDLGDNRSADDGVGPLGDESADEGLIPSTEDAAAPIRVDPPGDFNASGLVEQGDLDLVLGNWGKEVEMLSSSWVNERPAALVDQSALDQVLLNWGKAATFTSPVAHMPEASSMTVALLLIASVVGVRAAYKGIERRRSPAA